MLRSLPVPAAPASPAAPLPCIPEPRPPAPAYPPRSHATAPGAPRAPGQAAVRASAPPRCPLPGPVRRGSPAVGSLVLCLRGDREVGGEGGIRTHGGIAATPVFKTGAFNHSATSPTNQLCPQRHFRAELVSLGPSMALAQRAACGCAKAASCRFVTGGFGAVPCGLRLILRGVLQISLAVEAGLFQKTRQVFGQVVDEHPHRRQQAAARGKDGVAGALG